MEEAEQIYQRALTVIENALGPDYMLTLRTMKNLGLLYNDHDKLAEMVELVSI